MGSGQQDGSGPEGHEAPTDYEALRDALRGAQRAELAGPGDELGGFVIAGLIAVGGAAQVYRARQADLGGRVVALKVIAAKGCSERDRARFRREAKLLASIRHEHLASVHGLGENRGLLWFAMDLEDGPTLNHWARARRGAVADPRDIVRWGVQIAGALAAVHEAGVVHRDVKPSNVVLRPGIGDKPTWTAVLVDFGLALRADPADDTITALDGGTPAYAAPEQLLGRPVDARTDVFSLGATLHDLLSGRVGRREWRAAAGLPPLSGLCPQVDADLEAVISKAVDPAARWRYASAAALRDDLQAWLDGRPVTAAKSAPRIDRVTWALAIGLAVILSHTGTPPPCHHGPLVASDLAVGDVDGDGHDDVILGHAGHDGAIEGAGVVVLRSGRTDEVLACKHGTTRNEGFGQALDSIGDVDGDGCDDLVVSSLRAHLDQDGRNPRGRVTVLSGASLRALLVIDGVRPDEGLGMSLSAAGDLDGDEKPDFVTGHKEGAGPGRVTAFSSRTGEAIWSLAGQAVGDDFGTGLADMPDVDGDGVGEILIGVPEAHQQDPGHGYVLVVSGWRGEIIRRLDGTEGFGRSVDHAGDVNNDGSPDVIVGANGEHEGKTGFIVVISGKSLVGSDPVELERISGDSPGDELGFFCAGVGDFDKDGHDDIAFVAPGRDSDTLDDVGLVAVWSVKRHEYLVRELGATRGGKTSRIVGGDVFLHDGYADIVIGVTPSRASSVGYDVFRGRP